MSALSKRAPRLPVARPADHGHGELARAKWRASGLADEVAKRLRLEALTKDSTYDLMQAGRARTPLRVATLKIPYFDETGKVTSFYRLRFLEPLPGFAGIVEKPQRYVQAVGSLNEVYLPPILGRPWSEVLRDPSARLVITEGELKAAAGCAQGIDTLGLGGVDNWQAGKRGLPLLPALAHAKWAKREVVIVYDSDAATNPNVLRAQNQLARALTDRGALVTIAHLPAAPDGAKQGLDDFLIASGKGARAAFESLVGSATPYMESIALHEMNAEVAYIARPGFVLALKDGHEMSRDAFVGAAYANRKHKVPTGKDGALKETSTAKRWIEWPSRFELDRITYRPGGDRVLEDRGGQFWNAWPGWGSEAVPGDVSLWKRLLDLIFDGADKADRVWFEQWCAYPLQHPGTKLYTAAVLWGEKQGTGKSFVGELLRKIYGANGVAVGKRDLVGSFNSLFEKRQFIQGEEITGDERKDVADALKTLITQDEMTIRKKFVPEYVLPTCTNYLFTSNHGDAFFLADADRRFFVHKVTADPAPTEFWDRLHEWKEGGGPAHLFHHLLHVDVADFNPRTAAPMTSAKREMIDANKNDLELWCDRLRAGGVAADEALARLDGASPRCEIFTVAQLHRAFDSDGRYRFTPERVGRTLSAAGFPQRRFRVREVARYYAVREPEKWRTRTEHEWQQHVIKKSLDAKF